MHKAAELARSAAARNEVPVGCVITDKDGNIIGEGSNRCEELRNALAHAETEAIKEASEALGTWHLEGCTLYVTLEPCPMCAGAIINSRISTLVYGAKDNNKGACGSVLNIFEEKFGHRPAVYGGICAEECSGILSEFFKNVRGLSYEQNK